MTEHLTGQGHRRIAYLAAGTDFEGSNRLRGYRAALHAAGIEPQRSWVRSFEVGPFDAGLGFTGYGERETARWLREDWRKQRFTALLCHNDELAAGALRSLHRAGLKVPGDVAVAGFDGLQLAEHLSPPLTTMEAPLYSIGAHGVQRLLRQIKGQAETGPLEELLPAGLLSRGSTGALRTGTRGSTGA